MEAQAQIRVSPAEPGATAAALSAAGLAAPLSCDTPERIARGGECLELETDGLKAVVVLRRDGPVLWVDGVGRVEGDGLLAMGFDLAKETAAACGCSEVAFETARPGLVKLGVQHGFEVAGHIMKAKI